MCADPRSVVAQRDTERRLAGDVAELQLADSHDLIRVHGARVNNLKDISVVISKRRFTVLTGVSGSGKSSLSSARSWRSRSG